METFILILGLVVSYALQTEDGHRDDRSCSYIRWRKIFTGHPRDQNTVAASPFRSVQARVPLIGCVCGLDAVSTRLNLQRLRRDNIIK